MHKAWSGGYAPFVLCVLYTKRNFVRAVSLGNKPRPACTSRRHTRRAERTKLRNKAKEVEQRAEYGTMKRFGDDSSARVTRSSSRHRTNSMYPVKARYRLERCIRLWLVARWLAGGKPDRRRVELTPEQSAKGQDYDEDDIHRLAMRLNVHNTQVNIHICFYSHTHRYTHAFL